MTDPATGAVAVAMWSGPRNISTAMMRAFENRADTEVWDEPLYAYYLARTGLAHPGAEIVIEAGETNWREVAARCTSPPPGEATVFFQKQMTHHMLEEVERDWLRELRHFFLIRDPREVVASYARVREAPTVTDVGVEQQAELFDSISRIQGTAPPVVDSADILRDPPAMLGTLCNALGLPFSEAMLSWPAGRRDSDGVWAPWWYASVEASTGFAPYVARELELTPDLEALAPTCRPHYERLHARRLRAPGTG